MREEQKGVLALVAACTAWGLSALYYGQLRHVPPLEVLSYRCIWGLAFFVLILAVQGRLSLVPQALKSRRQTSIMLLAAILISANWFGFIYAISTNQALEASLGYYIFPLVAVVIGRVVFAETLLGVQWVAVALVAIAVLILALGLGVTPWIALLLAGTFGTYGMIKKQLDIGPVVSVTCEVLLLAPLAVAWIWLKGTGVGAENSLGAHAYIAIAGPLTATPLIMFSYAAKRIRMATVGLVQYLNPTLQLAVAALVFLEPVTIWHVIALPIIWVALALYSGSSWRQDKAARPIVPTA